MHRLQFVSQCFLNFTIQVIDFFVNFCNLITYFRRKNVEASLRLDSCRLETGIVFHNISPYITIELITHFLILFAIPKIIGLKFVFGTCFGLWIVVLVSMIILLVSSVWCKCVFCWFLSYVIIVGLIECSCRRPAVLSRWGVTWFFLVCFRVDRFASGSSSAIFFGSWVREEWLFL